MWPVVFLMDGIRVMSSLGTLRSEDNAVQIWGAPTGEEVQWLERNKYDDDGGDTRVSHGEDG